MRETNRKKQNKKGKIERNDKQKERLLKIKNEKYVMLDQVQIYQANIIISNYN